MPYGAVPLAPPRATDPGARDKNAEAALTVMEMITAALWFVAVLVVLPLTLFGVIHYIIIDIFIFLAASASLYLVYVYGMDVKTCCCCFSVTGGTRLLALTQLIPMLFILAVEASNIFVGTMRGSGFVAVNWATQLFGSFAIFLGLPFVVAGLVGTVTRSPSLVKLFLYYETAYFVLGMCFSAAVMYKGPDVCAYYAVLGAAKCGEARLVELGMLVFDLVFQIYVIWVVRSCVHELQGGMDKGFATLLAGHQLGPREHYGHLEFARSYYK
jgi:hypothetical protein